MPHSFGLQLSSLSLLSLALNSPFSYPSPAYCFLPMLHPLLYAPAPCSSDNQVQNEHTHLESRSACAAYASSFLARAKFMPMDEVLQWVKQMLIWATEYQQYVLARLGGQAPALDVQLHGVFYSLIQVLLLA